MIKRSIFVNGVIVTIAAVACVFLYKYILQSNQNATTDLILDCVGLVIVLCGQYIRASARGYKSLKHSSKPVLVQDGPYAFVRNPMYLASFLIGLGLVIVLMKWWMVPVYLIFFTAWYWPQIYSEQHWMRNKFGQDYEQYCKTVPCMLPKLKTICEFKITKYLPMKAAWLKREWNTILAWSMAMLVLEGYEDVSAFQWTVFARELAVLLLIAACFAMCVTWAVKASRSAIESVSR